MKKIYLTILIMLLMMLPSAAFAAVEAGMITALKGNAIIQRGAEMVSAKIREKIFVNDIISVVEFSRVKIKFTDDSVITLYQNSKMNVKDYLFKNDGTRGRSIINLIDGKLKSLVGKTNFEVHTATSVAAARGTHFFLQCSLGDCLLAVFEGTVGFRRVFEGVEQEILVRKGEFSSIKISADKPAAPTEPVKMPKGMVKDLLSCKIVEPD